MEAELADRLIRDRQDLVHVRLIGGPYLSVHLKYDPSFQEKCFDIPSWVAVYGPSPGPKMKPPFKYFRVHMFDLYRLGKVAEACRYEMHFDEGLLDHLRKVKDEYDARLKLKLEQAPDLVIQGLRRPLRPYQQLGSQFMYECGRVLNADGMGSGKTAQAVGAVMLNRQLGEPHRTLVTCPASMKDAWRREFAAMSDMRVLVLDSNMDRRARQYEDIAGYDVVVVGFEGFLADYEDIAQLFQPNIVVIDECHRICNRTNKITQVMVGGKEIRKTFPSMCANLHSVYLLTGTPIMNKLEDLYTLLRLMDPGIFNWRGFANRYTLRETKTRWERKMVDGRMKAFPREYSTIEGYQNQDELSKRLHLYMIRRTKDQILPDLPKKVYQVIDIDLDAEERRAYNALRDEYKAEVRGQEITVKNAMTWMLRAQQVADSLELVAGSSVKKSSKLAELKRIVDEQSADHKIVIFSRFRKMTDIIVRDLAHLKPVHFHGGVKAEDRPGLIDAFQTDPSRRVFVSTLGAGGVGITLTAADIVIFYDTWWAPSQNNQAADRLHRIGCEVHESILVVTLMAKDTVDEHVAGVWAEKQELINEVVNDEDVIKEMTQEMRERMV